MGQFLSFLSKRNISRIFFPRLKKMAKIVCISLLLAFMAIAQTNATVCKANLGWTCVDKYVVEKLSDVNEKCATKRICLFNSYFKEPKDVTAETKKRTDALIKELKNKFGAKIKSDVAYNTKDIDTLAERAGIFGLGCNNFALQHVEMYDAGDKTKMENMFKEHRAVVNWKKLFDQAMLVGDVSKKAKVWCGVAHGCLTDEEKKMYPGKTHFTRYACSFQ